MMSFKVVVSILKASTSMFSTLRPPTEAAPLSVNDGPYRAQHGDKTALRGTPLRERYACGTEQTKKTKKIISFVSFSKHGGQQFVAVSTIASTLSCHCVHDYLHRMLTVSGTIKHLDKSLDRAWIYVVIFHPKISN